MFAVCKMDVCSLCRSTLKSASQQRNCSRALAASCRQAGKYVAPSYKVQDYVLPPVLVEAPNIPSGSLPS